MKNTIIIYLQQTLFETRFFSFSFYRKNGFIE